ncbi:MAG: preprotein translocase subunit SecE [Candidatus Kapabacteria bacterium]|nr:preprotein translocase subunit SecE [Candidatus Kapabacteria bacterium]
MIGKIKAYVADVRKEMSKVAWPTKEQLRESTVVVVTTTLVLTVFIYIVDFVLDQAVGVIF